MKTLLPSVIAFCLVSLVAAPISRADPGPSVPTFGFGFPSKPKGTAPAITTQPLSQSVTTGATVTLSAAATGTATLFYQWSKDGRSIRGATAASFVITGAKTSDAGGYTVSVSNSAGRASSALATLSVANAGVVTSAPKNQTINTGSTLTFAVAATGTGLKYQWEFNAVAISGATSATYSVANIGPGASGTYLVDVSNATAVIAADVATLSVVTNARLTNLSIRGQVGTGSQDLVVGFVTSGSANKQILLRAVGPTLGTSFAVTGALSAPDLTLYGFFNKTIATNSGWGGTTALSQVFAQVGAFALGSKSLDSALLESLAPGGYTADVTGVKGATGVALAEIYDADTGSPTSDIVNVSGRAYVAGGGSVLVAGFVIAGPTSETVLIRGVGPTLGGFFNFFGALKSTMITLADSKGKAITANAGWGDDPLISNTGSQVGAFPLMAHSQDSALLVTLAPGSYTASVTGTNGSTGTGMVEIYEVK